MISFEYNYLKKMTDHPLVSYELRQYIQTNQIEDLLNTGLNLVMETLPSDPYSTMAATLIKVIYSTYVTV